MSESMTNTSLPFCESAIAIADPKCPAPIIANFSKPIIKKIKLQTYIKIINAKNKNKFKDRSYL